MKNPRFNRTPWDIMVYVFCTRGITIHLIPNLRITINTIGGLLANDNSIINFFVFINIYYVYVYFIITASATVHISRPQSTSLQSTDDRLNILQLVYVTEFLFYFFYFRTSFFVIMIVNNKYDVSPFFRELYG